MAAVEDVWKIMEKAKRAEGDIRYLHGCETKRELRERTGKKEWISVQEVKMGSRRGAISKVRTHLALKMVEELGIPLAEIARQLGVSTSAVSPTLRRKQIN